jgi:hypothetical protein
VLDVVEDKSRSFQQLRTTTSNEWLIAPAVREIEERGKAGLERILTSAELEEYQMCTSSVGDQLRTQLEGFDPTESEFRQLYYTAKMFEGKPNGEKERFQPDWIVAALNDARQKDFLLSRNERFRQVHRLTTRLGLPWPTAAKVHDLREARFKEIGVVGTDNSIPPRMRQARIDSIKADLRAALQELIGEAGVAAYVENEL